MGKLENSTAKTIMKNGAPVLQASYAAMGNDHVLQREITRLMHCLAMDAGLTLAELGYLHMNSITFVEDHVEVKAYFAPEVATQYVKGFGNRRSLEISENFDIFQNYLFVGDRSGAISFENITAPKYTVEEDDAGRPAIHLSTKDKVQEDVEVLVLHCNLDVVMAAINDTNIMDPMFTVEYETMGDTSKKNQIMISAGSKQEFPVQITVTYSAEDEWRGYDPDMAVPYLIGKLNRGKEARETQKTLKKKISEKAGKLNKKAAKAQTVSWSKFR